MVEHLPDDVLPPRQRNWVLLLSAGILYLTLDLVRRRKVREDDSWIWLFVGFSTFLFGTQYRLLKRFGGLLGIVTPTSTIFFFGQLFLMFLALQTSIRNASLQEALKNLAQHQAILQSTLVSRHTGSS